MEIGQIIRPCFQICPKNHDPSSLRLQKTNRMKYDRQIKMVLYDLRHTGLNLHMTPAEEMSHLHPQLTFD